MKHTDKHSDHDMAGLDPLAAQAFTAFKLVMREHRILMAEMAGGHGSHPAQAGCLHVLAHGDGISHSEIADILRVSKPTVTTMLQKMERAGLIERRQDESDQRRTLVFLTKEGRRAALEMKKVFRSVVEAGFGRMDEADKRELTRLLKVVSENLASAHLSPEVQC